MAVCATETYKQSVFDEPPTNVSVDINSADVKDGRVDWRVLNTHTHTQPANQRSVLTTQTQSNNNSSKHSNIQLQLDRSGRQQAQSQPSLCLIMPRSTVQLSCRPTWQPRLSRPACLYRLDSSFHRHTATLSHHNVSPTPIKPTIKTPATYPSPAHKVYLNTLT